METCEFNVTTAKYEERDVRPIKQERRLHVLEEADGGKN